MNHFDSIPKELLNKIIQATGLKALANVAQVCSSWSQLTTSSEYWRDYMTRWENCRVMQPAPNAAVHLFPTRRQGDVLVPDYKRYYFVRKNIEELLEEIKDLDDIDYALYSRINAAANSELTQENFARLQATLESTQITSDISTKVFWFYSDFYKIYFERQDPQYKELSFPRVYGLVDNATKIQHSAIFLHLAWFCEKDLDLSAKFFNGACSRFVQVEEPSESYSRVFRGLILQQIDFGRFANEKISIAQFKFCTPNEQFVHEIIVESTPDADALHEILCQIVQERYNHATDWRIQASALTTLIQTTTHDNDRVKATAILLGLDAIKSSNAVVRQHGYVALHAVLVMFENDNLTAKETLQLFDALSDAIDTQPRNFGIYFVEAILCLINETNNEIVTDEKLSKLSNSIIEMLLDETAIDENNKAVLISLCKLGTVFGARSRSVIPRYKYALLSVIAKRKIVPSAELLDMYLRIGHGIMGDGFSAEALDLLQQAEDGAKELGTIDLPLFYALSGDILPKVLNQEFKKNSSRILQHMLEFFSEDFENLGQSCLLDMRDDSQVSKIPALPETAEHSKRYFKEILQRMQNGESLSAKDADAILLETYPSEQNMEDVGMGSEFIKAPDVFASDALMANDGAKLISQKLGTLQYRRGIVNLMNTVLVLQQDAFPFIQRVFHIGLAGFRSILQDERFIRPFTELVKLIATLMTKQQLAYYLFILAKDMLYYMRQHKELAPGTIEAVYELFSVTFSFAVSNPLETTSKLLHYLLDFIALLDRNILNNTIDDFEHVSCLECLSVLITKMPNKTRRAIPRSLVTCDSEEGAFEMILRASAIVGFAFGVDYLERLMHISGINDTNTPLEGFRNACLRIIPKYSPDMSYNIMKPFVVLLSCCIVDNSIKHFIEMRKVYDHKTISDAINHEDFDTGDELLNAEVKKLANNPFVLFAALKRK